MLVEIAIGDAYGFGFEYADENLPSNDLSRYIKHTRWGEGLEPGMYTDDTQMSLAIAECLLEGPLTKENFTRHFVIAFKRDQRNGYARHFQTFLESINDEKEFLAKIKPDSDKPGGAMRAGPIGYLKTAFEVQQVASLQASITHDTPDGRAAAEACALMCWYFINSYGPKTEVGKWLESFVPSHKWSEPYNERIKDKGWMDVRAAVTCIQEEKTSADVLKRIVAMGGDVDTAGAISMAAASQCREMDQNLPEHLYWGLENGAYGRDYLATISEQLRAKFRPPQLVSRGRTLAGK